MRDDAISRAGFMSAVGLGMAGAAGLLPTSGARADGSRRECGLTYRGVGYEVADGGYAATGWHERRMRDDLRSISEDLHANSVSVFGTGVERLATTATEAAENGLHVWLQPRLADLSHDQILEHLAETGKHAESMRRCGARVQLSVGCEFYLFVPGIVPGANALERIENLQSGNYDQEKMKRRLVTFTRRAAKVARSVFNGKLTYGAAYGDVVEWDLFDIVSVDYYSYFRRRADYVRELRELRRWGKPVAIAEFGSCTFEGAPKKGGMGWGAIDYDGPEPVVKPGVIRSEREQAAYIADLLGIFESMNLYAATVYQFISPDDPHRVGRKYDLDIASYGIVKPIWKSHDRPTADWHWEPKESFRALARHYGRKSLPN